MPKTKRLVVYHKPTQRKAVVSKVDKNTKFGLIIDHILNRNSWLLADVKLKHLVNN